MWNLPCPFLTPSLSFPFSLSVLFPPPRSGSAALGPCQLKQIAVSQTTTVLGRCQSGCRAQRLIMVGYKVNTNEINILFSLAIYEHVMFMQYIGCSLFYPVVYLSSMTVNLGSAMTYCSNFEWVHTLYTIYFITIH